MKGLTDAEVELLHELVTSRWDDELHYPEQYTSEEKAASSTLGEKVFSEAKRRKLWWTR